MEDYKIIDWLKALGSKTPTPGGGTVAGLNGAIAVAQLKMICEYTKNELPNQLMLDNKIHQFLKSSEEDARAYLQLKEAYRSKSEEAVQRALAGATKPSLQIINISEETYSFCEINFELFNKNLISDLVVALANLATSIESAQTMLKVNASSMHDGADKSDVLQRIKYCSELIAKINRLKNTAKQGIV